ncbi:MAG: hypothetical protein KDD66_06755 [Bdellovibrionales bacterium]|nr:hypothetical protein [Bdellovibrionales bacterium]
MKKDDSIGDRVMKLRMQCSFKLWPVFFAAALIVPAAAFAQSVKGTDEGAAVMMDDWTQSWAKANALGDAFGGDSTLNHGYKRSPILFDNCRVDNYGNKSNCRRKYPKLHQDTALAGVTGIPEGHSLLGSGEMPVPDTRSLVQSVSTDDEITRATMAVYHPLFQIKNGVAEDVKKRDDYLDLFKTIRGVANLTLSYLDKTVAAGLATTESQVNQETHSLLLKQISWTNSRLANPQRSQIYVDADEKLQACLNTFGGTGPGLGPQMGAGRFSDMSPTNCVTECGIMPTDATLRYGFCVCCVQHPDHATISAGVDGITGSVPPDKWSLVDRYFHGVKALQAGQGLQEVLNFATFIKEMYGDVIVDKNGYHFVWPKFGIADKIHAIRDGCSCTTSCTAPTFGGASSGQPCQPPNKGSSGGTLICPFTGQQTSFGIKAAVKHVLRMKDAPWDSMSPEEHRVWVEASAGTLMTPAIKKAALMLQDGTEEPLGCNEEPEGKLSRWILNFTDSSAVSAFEKLHYRTKALLANHDVLNLRMTPNDRRMFWTMIDRVDRFIQMAKADTASDRAAVQAVTEATISRDRRKQADMAAAIAANVASQNMSEAIAGTARFGDFTDICTGTTC